MPPEGGISPEGSVSPEGLLMSIPPPEFPAGLPAEPLPRRLSILAAAENLGYLRAVHGPASGKRQLASIGFFTVTAVIGLWNPVGSDWRIDFLPARPVLYVVGALSVLMVLAGLAANPLVNRALAKRRIYLYDAGFVLFDGGKDHAELVRWEAIADVKQKTVNTRRRSVVSWKVTRRDGRTISIAQAYANHDALGVEVTRRVQELRQGIAQGDLASPYGTPAWGQSGPIGPIGLDGPNSPDGAP
jgi:hypothetical protein